MEWRKLKRAKNVTWVIYCEHGPDNEREVSYGGGFCVNPQGLLVTVGHILPRDNRKIYARCISDTKFREAVVLKGQEWPKLDVALLWVHKLYPDETFHHVEEFEFLRGLNPSVSDYGDAVYAYLHLYKTTYTYAEGCIAYPLPPAGVIQPELTDKTILKHAERRHLRAVRCRRASEYEDPTKAMAQSFRYRKLSHLHSEYIDDDLIIHPHPSKWNYFNPEIPLVQVSGLRILDDTSRCPLFRKKDHLFVGMVALKKGSSCYAFPFTTIASALATLGSFPFIQRPLGLFRLRTIIYPPPPAKKKLVMMTDTLARMSSGPGVSLSRDTPPPEAMKSCTWVIHVEFKRNGDSVTRVGGGVCIDEMGAILTVAHVIPDIQRYTIKALQFNEGGVGDWVNVSVLRRWVDQDVAILLVKRLNKEEKFPFAELTRGLSLVESEPAFMFSHQDSVGYSLHDGVVAYQCPFYVNEHDYVGDMEEAHQRNFLCRAAGHLIIGDDEDEIRHLDPKAPLLQLSGVDDYSGSSGTPYYRKSDNLLIGIMSLSVCNAAYGIPLKTLISLVETLSEPQESRSKQKRQRDEETDVSNPHDLVHRHGSGTQGTCHLSETGACSKNQE